MDFHVEVEITFLRKTLFTNVAFVWFVSRLLLNFLQIFSLFSFSTLNHVNTAIFIDFESFPAFSALKWLFSILIVHPQRVICQLPFFIEPFSTNIAIVLIVFGVSQLMLFCLRCFSVEFILRFLSQS